MLQFFHRAVAIFGAVVAASLTTFTAPISAAPGDPEALIVPASAVGIPQSLDFWSFFDTQTLVVPVADGVTPGALEVTVEFSPAIASGSVDVVAENRLLARVALSATPGERISLPLDEVPVIDGQATFDLRTHVFAIDGQCPLDSVTPLVRFTYPYLSFNGFESQPTTVADFLPPLLQRLSIYIPASPKPSETQAALELAADLVSQYRQQPVLIETHALIDGQVIADHPSGPLERQIAITDGENAHVELRTDGPAPILQIVGSGPQLADQVRLVTSDLSRLAVTPRAAAGPLAPHPQIAPEHTTLQELGQRNLSATSLARVSVDIGLDQTRLGRAVRNVVLDLRGTYTPVPESHSGRIVVLVGDRELGSWPVSPDGRFERSLEIPDELLGRFTTVEVRLDESGSTAGCGLEHPLTLEIDPASEVHTELADRPRPGGFAALPQALLPRTEIGLLAGGFDDTRRAISIVSGLQRLSHVPLIPALVPFEEAASGDGPAVLIAANGGIPDSVELPLTQVEVNKLSVAYPDGRTDLEVSPGIAFASVQAAFTGDRMVLAATSTGTPETLDDILRQLDADPLWWNRLSGDVLFETPGRPLEMLSIADKPIPTGAAAPPGSMVGEIVTVAAVLAVIGCGAAVVVLVRARRSGD